MILSKLSCCAKNPQVKVVDDSLVLSFPEALEPVVWRMQLSHAKQAGFEIRENQGKFQLIRKDGKDVEEIAGFQDRGSAVGALMDISNALQGGGRHKGGAASGGRHEAIQWLIAVAGVVIVGLMFLYLGKIAPVEPQGLASASTAASQAASGDPATSSGVPVSADDFLKGQ